MRSMIFTTSSIDFVGVLAVKSWSSCWFHQYALEKTQIVVVNHPNDLMWISTSTSQFEQN